MKLSRRITQKVAWSTAVQYLGKVLQIALGVITVKWVTNALGPEAFGQYGRIVEFTLFFSVAANLGVFGNIVRKMSDAPEDGKLFTNALLLRAGLSLPFFLIAFIAALIWNPNSLFIGGMLFFMSSLFFDHLTSICNAALQANYWMGRSTLAMTLARVIELALVVLLAKQAASMPFFFLAPLGASLAALIMTTLFVRKRFKLEWSLDKKLIQSLFLTALPFGIINIINNLYFRFLPSFFMGQALTDEQFSFYSLSLNIAMTASLFSTFLMFSVLPIFKHSLTEGNKERAQNMFKLAIIILSLGALAMIGVGTILAPWTISVVSNAGFWQTEIWHLFPLLLLLAGVSYFYDLILITIFALEKEIWLLKREGITLILGTGIMAVSLLSQSTSARVTWIIAGAIIAELFLVTLSMRQIRRWLN